MKYENIKNYKETRFSCSPINSTALFMDIKNYKETRFRAVTGVTTVTFNTMLEDLRLMIERPYGYYEVTPVIFNEMPEELKPT